VDDLNLEGIATAIGVIVALLTYVRTARREKAIRQAELVRGYTRDLSMDPALVDLFTDIDYERFRFVADEATWLGRRPEQDVVRMLDLFNSAGHNWRRDILSLDDIHGTTLGYAILRAHQDPQVQRYLAHVDHWDAEHLGTGVAFENFRALAVALDERSREARAARIPAVVPPG
jgi:hypothetical protein